MMHDLCSTVPMLVIFFFPSGSYCVEPDEGFHRLYFFPHTQYVIVRTACIFIHVVHITSVCD